jgi:anti-sigma factor RsiW
MNPDDETFLTAYLDGELAPAELARVEQALRSDPNLADRLGELARVRDLVAGLPRPPAPFDLSASVVRRLAPAPARVRRFGPRGGRFASYWEVALSAAAVFLAAGFVGYLALLRDLHGPAKRAGRMAVVSAPAPAPAPAAAPAVAERPAARPRAQPSARKGGRVSPAAAGTQVTAAEQEQFRAMIDSPNLKRIFFVVDAVGGHAGERVGELVDSLPRADSVYACMTIVPNVVVDPSHPGAAKVFAVALTDPELRQVRDQLHEAFPNGVEEAEPDPAVVTQLADVGQVSLLPGTAVADLESPAETEARIAIKDRHDGDPVEGAEGAEAALTPERYRSAPAPYVDQRRRGAGPALAARPPAGGLGPAPAPGRGRADRPAIVLIWVASR